MAIYCPNHSGGGKGWTSRQYSIHSSIHPITPFVPIKGDKGTKDKEGPGGGLESRLLQYPSFPSQTADMSLAHPSLPTLLVQLPVAAVVLRWWSSFGGDEVLFFQCPLASGSCMLVCGACEFSHATGFTCEPDTRGPNKLGVAPRSTPEGLARWGVPRSVTDRERSELDPPG